MIVYGCTCCKTLPHVGVWTSPELLLKVRAMFAQAHMTQLDIQQLDVQRATWLAARMLAEAADARMPEARGAAVPTESLIAGLVRPVAVPSAPPGVQ